MSLKSKGWKIFFAILIGLSVLFFEATAWGVENRILEWLFEGLIFFPVWIIPLSLYHIRSDRHSTAWHVRIGLLFFLLYYAFLFLCFFVIGHCNSGEGCFFLLVGLIISWVVNSILNLIVQNIIGFYKRKKLNNKSDKTEREGLMPRVINTDKDNNSHE